jgi:hypothetical protein
MFAAAPPQGRQVCPRQRAWCRARKRRRDGSSGNPVVSAVSAVPAVGHRRIIAPAQARLGSLSRRHDGPHHPHEFGTSAAPGNARGAAPVLQRRRRGFNRRSRRIPTKVAYPSSERRMRRRRAAPLSPEARGRSERYRPRMSAMKDVLAGATRGRRTPNVGSITHSSPQVQAV